MPLFCVWGWEALPDYFQMYPDFRDYKNETYIFKSWSRVTTWVQGKDGHHADNDQWLREVEKLPAFSRRMLNAVHVGEGGERLSAKSVVVGWGLRLETKKASGSVSVRTKHWSQMVRRDERSSPQKWGARLRLRSAYLQSNWLALFNDFVQEPLTAWWWGRETSGRCLAQGQRRAVEGREERLGGLRSPQAHRAVPAEKWAVGPEEEE